MARSTPPSPRLQLSPSNDRWGETESSLSVSVQEKPFCRFPALSSSPQFPQRLSLKDVDNVFKTRFETRSVKKE